jgi:hypothetical protein
MKMKVVDLRVGMAVHSIELTVARLEDGKAPVGKVPYQHTQLTDGSGEIRFTLFGGDIGKLSQGEVVEITNAYVSEYPKDSGKLSLMLNKESEERKKGTWKVVEKLVASTAAVAVPFWQSDQARQEMIVKQSSLRSACTLLSVSGLADPKPDALKAIEIAEMFTDWVMGDMVVTEQPTDEKSWVYDDKIRSGFWAKMNAKSLSHNDVHTALQVASLKDFKGTEQAALDMVEAWLNGELAKGKAKEEPPF